MYNILKNEKDCLATRAATRYLWRNIYIYIHIYIYVCVCVCVGVCVCLCVCVVLYK